MEINPKDSVSTSKGPSRRNFAKKVAWTAPALTLMMAASSQPARANFTYGHTLEANRYSGPSSEGDQKKKNSGYQFWKVWKSVHRGRSM